MNETWNPQGLGFLASASFSRVAHPSTARDSMYHAISSCIRCKKPMHMKSTADSADVICQQCQQQLLMVTNHFPEILECY